MGLHDGLSWEEAAPSSLGDQGYNMKVGAASKGIIQRDFQHHVTVFKSPYAKNPFDSVSNEELEEYKRIIGKKSQNDESIASGPVSPLLEEDTTDQEEDSQSEFKSRLERSLSTRTGPGQPQHLERNTPRSKSLGRGAAGLAKMLQADELGEQGYNDETDNDGNRTFSEGEGDTSRATDPDSAMRPKKEKKKKGLRTPSFLKKKKKKDKKEKEAAM